MKNPKTAQARRGRPSSLTHERIIEAALRLIRDRRLEDVSMREIAGELNVPVMTLYNYVASKDELSVLIVDHILRPVRVPAEDEGTWRERLRMLERDARQAMAKHRGVSIRNGVRSTEAMRLADGVLSILTASGFSRQEATRAFAVLYTFMVGQIEVDAFFGSAQGRGEPTFENVTGGEQPTRDELFEFGFDVVLAGLEAVLGADDRPAARNLSRIRSPAS
jgi:AcrR family transcriptional regulator